MNNAATLAISLTKTLWRHLQFTFPIESDKLFSTLIPCVMQAVVAIRIRIDQPQGYQ